MRCIFEQRRCRKTILSDINKKIKRQLHTTSLVHMNLEDVPIFICYSVKSFVSLTSECKFATNLKKSVKNKIGNSSKYHIMFDHRHT